MILLEAKDQAKKESLAQKKPFYVFVDKDGEADISSAPLAGTLHKFVDGVEVKDFKVQTPTKVVKPTLPAQSEKAQKLINKKEMKTKKSAAKKVAKKSAPAKPAGKLITMPIKAILTKIKAGAKAFNDANKPLPEKYLAKMKDQSREIKVILISK